VPAPQLSEHCNAILSELGYAQEQIQSLVQSKVVVGS